MGILNITEKYQWFCSCSPAVVEQLDDEFEAWQHGREHLNNVHYQSSGAFVTVIKVLTYD